MNPSLAPNSNILYYGSATACPGWFSGTLLGSRNTQTPQTTSPPSSDLSSGELDIMDLDYSGPPKPSWLQITRKPPSKSQRPKPPSLTPQLQSIPSAQNLFFMRGSTPSSSIQTGTSNTEQALLDARSSFTREELERSRPSLDGMYAINDPWRKLKSHHSFVLPSHIFTGRQVAWDQSGSWCDVSGSENLVVVAGGDGCCCWVVESWGWVCDLIQWEGGNDLSSLCFSVSVSITIYSTCHRYNQSRSRWLSPISVGGSRPPLRKIWPPFSLLLGTNYQPRLVDWLFGWSISYEFPVNIRQNTRGQLVSQSLDLSVAQLNYLPPVDW